MNLNIKFFLIFAIFVSGFVWAEKGLDKILRDAIIENGFKSPEEIYFNPNEELAPQGKIFFKSKHLSLNGKISCATCHISKKGSSDGIPNAAGVRGMGEGRDRLLSGAKIVPRNTLALWGVGSKNFKTFFWDGRVDFSDIKVISQFGSQIPSPDPLVTAVHLPVVEIRETLEEDDFVLAHKQESLGGAKSVYEAIVKKLIRLEPEAMKDLARKIGVDINEVTFLDVATSIASFIRSEFRIKNTKLNDFVNRKHRLSNEELRGGLVFYGKGNCISCHSGPHFTNQKFYTVAFPQLGFGKNGFGFDYGRYNATFNPKDLYKFRTPSLYNVSKTSPYGHSGSLLKVDEAVRAHYDPLSLIKIENYSSLQRHQLYKYLAQNDTVNKVNFLSEDEVNHLVKFLRTLDFD